MSLVDFLFYFNLGWQHIVSLDALDHQLFILVLVVAFSNHHLKQIFILVTAFTIGHSVTLALSVLDYVRLDSVWVEFLIPCTIAATALVNIFKKEKLRPNYEVSYYLAFFFGLVHGMGFANTARMMLAKGQSLAMGLFGFNFGLEVGQLLFVAILLVIATIVLSLFRVRKREWVLFVSSAVFALAVEMCLNRLPF